MRRPRLRHRPRRQGVSNIIAVMFLVALTIVAGTALWTLTFRFPSQGMYVTYIARAGLKIPAWGDPTDCVPYGYPIGPGSSWGTNEQNAWWTNCYDNQVGNYSLMNASTIVFTGVSPETIPLTQVQFDFLCHNTTPVSETTLLVSGSLASMTWYPGSTTSAAPDAPTLGSCGTFDANGWPPWDPPAFGTLYNRLGIFTPIQPGVSVLQAGDTFTLYVHTPGSLYDPGPPAYGGSVVTGPDTDDYHGAPSWCFTQPGACDIKIVYTGNPMAVLADIPVYSISGAGQ